MKTTSMVAMALALAGTVDAACADAEQTIAVPAVAWKLMDGSADSTISVSTAGTVCQSATANTVELAFTLTDSAASGGCGSPTSGTANSCGIHLHSGTCATPGGHAYDTSITTDPWTTVYVSGTGVTLSVETKQDIAAVAGQILIAHKMDGTKYACAPVTAAGGTLHQIKSPFGKVAAYTGSVTVEVTELYVGFPAPTATSTKQVLYGKIKADTGCTFAADKSSGNKCGIHLHKGTCADIGGHMFKSPVSSDPWDANQVYSSDKAFALPLIDTGYKMSEVMDLIVVVHDAAGTKIACAPVKNPTPSSSAASVGVGATSVLVLAAIDRKSVV